MKSKKIIPLKANSALAEMAVETNKKDLKEKPVDRAARLSKEYIESNTMPLRREAAVIAIDQLQTMVHAIIQWRALFIKNGKAFAEQDAALMRATNTLQVYLAYKVKEARNLKAPLVARLNYLLKLFRRYELEDDSFVNMEYQPLIFLRELSGMFSDIALAISSELKQKDEITTNLLTQSHFYFPRCYRMGYRNFDKDKLRKMAYMEKISQQAKQKQWEVEDGIN